MKVGSELGARVGHYDQMHTWKFAIMTRGTCVLRCKVTRGPQFPTHFQPSKSKARALEESPSTRFCGSVRLLRLARPSSACRWKTGASGIAGIADQAMAGVQHPGVPRDSLDSQGGSSRSRRTSLDSSRSNCSFHDASSRHGALMGMDDLRRCVSLNL
jgi:hypothetical protein